MQELRTEPLVLTMTFDDRSFSYFDALRKEFFPPDRNVLSAHLTLFHKLPGTELKGILTAIQAAAGCQPQMPLSITGLRSLGRGVAFECKSEALGRFRGALAAEWHSFLAPQDRAGFNPHITIQNKVTRAEAAITLARLKAEFSPFEATGAGVELSRYLGGPWEHVAQFRFTRLPCGAAICGLNRA